MTSMRGSRFGLTTIPDPSAHGVAGDRPERVDPAVVERRADRRRAERDRAGPDRGRDADELGLTPRAREAKPAWRVVVDSLDRSRARPERPTRNEHEVERRDVVLLQDRPDRGRVTAERDRVETGREQVRV